MKFFVRLALLVLLALFVVFLWGVLLTSLPSSSLLPVQSPRSSQYTAQWAWLSDKDVVESDVSSKQTISQPQHDLNMIGRSGVLSDRIVAQPPELLSKDKSSSLVEKIPTKKDNEGKALSYRKSEKGVQLEDARKGRSMQSFAVAATNSVKRDEDPDAIKLSEHPNMEVRGKWQQKVISDFCHRHGFDNLIGTLPDDPARDDFFRRIIYDENHKALFCFLPKVGCTNMRVSLLVSSHRVSQSVLKLQRKKVYVERRLERALKNASFLSTSLTNKTMLMMITQFQRYTIIRHPLERLASAYRDKMALPLMRVMRKKTFTYFEQLKYTILQEYEPHLYQKWTKEGKRENVTVSFPVFIAYLIDRNSSEVVNEHFTMQVDNCQPCRMHYHFYGNFKTFVNDSKQILSKFMDTNSLYPFSNQSYHKPGQETHNLLSTYYSQLTPDLKERLHQHMRLELDFYHSLYPTEKQLTKDLLGLS